MPIYSELLKSTNPKADTSPTVVLIHGLFGEGKNLKLLADGLNTSFHTLVVDLRNHGNSFHHAEHNYSQLAQDVVDCLNAQNLKKIHLIGHSMGGKVVMKLAEFSDGLGTIEIEKMIVLDIAPVKYSERKHDDVFLALKKTLEAECKTRLDASKIMHKYIDSKPIIQFLLKSFDNGTWRFNLTALEENYKNILDWQELSPSQIKILFLIGANSDYVIPAHRESILRQFPNSKAHIISGASHWVHADKPEQVLKQSLNFLNLS